MKVSALLSGGASPNLREMSDVEGHTPLSFTASRPATVFFLAATRRAIIRLLCEAGAEKEARYAGPQAGLVGFTAVGCAVASESIPALRALAAAGASLDAPQGVAPAQWPPLWLAIDRKLEAVANVLLDLGASAAASVAGPGGETLLQAAVRQKLRMSVLAQRLRSAAAGKSVSAAGAATVVDGDGG